VRWDTEFPVRSLPEMFDDAVAPTVSRELTNFLGATLTYAEMGQLTNRLAAGLQARGIGRGHRVGLFLPNTPYYIAAYFAILKTGATVVNFNPLYSVEELMGQAKDSSISAMVTLDLAVLFDKVAEVAGKGLIETVVVCPFAESPAALQGLAVPGCSSAANSLIAGASASPSAASPGTASSTMTGASSRP
jgi:long-chain acyl-CoA synthetase